MNEGDHVTIVDFRCLFDALAFEMNKAKGTSRYQRIVGKGQRSKTIVEIFKLIEGSQLRLIHLLA